MGQGPTPFLRATAQLDGPGTPCHRLTARVGRKRAALPRTEATTHQTRTPAQCTIAIVHEQGTEVRSEMNTREQGAEVRSGLSFTICWLSLNTSPPPVHLPDAEPNKTAHKTLLGSTERIPRRARKHGRHAKQRRGQRPSRGPSAGDGAAEPSPER